jgi:hypothetical protein
VEADGRGQVGLSVLGRLDVQDRDLNAAVPEELRDLSSDPATPAREDDNLPVPVVLVCEAIVENALIEPCVYAADDGERSEDLKSPEGFWMVEGCSLTF